MIAGLLAAAAAAPLQVWDLTLDDAGLVATGDTLQWAWSDAPAAGPGGASWGTNPDGPYLHDTDDSLVIDLPPLGGATQATLLMEHAYDIAAGDSAQLEIDAGAGWVVVDPIGGYPTAEGFVGDSLGWVDSAFDLSGLGDDLQARLRLVADPSQAAEGWYVRRLELHDADVVAPRITPLVLPSDNQDLVGPYRVQLSMVDTVALVDPTVWWSTGGVPAALPMQDVGNGVYEAEVPGQPPDTVVSWFATVSDTTQEARYPEEGEATFRVYLAAPKGLLADLDGARVATEVDLSWTPPVTPHPVVGYELTEEGGQVIAVDEAATQWPLAPGGSRRFSVRADYGALGQGDASPTVQVSVEVPELDELAPSSVARGERRYVLVQGEGLYLLQGRSTFTLGAGVVVEEADVVDVGTATLRIAVDGGAVAGPRALVIDGPQGVATFEGAFEVLEQGNTPTIVSVAPDAVVQGREVEIVAMASAAFAGPVQVEAGDGLVLTQPAVVSGEEVRFGLAARSDAAPGPRTVVLDDGIRLWGVDITVEAYRAPPQRSCSAAPGVVGAWAWLGLAGALCLRQRGRSWLR